MFSSKMPVRVAASHLRKIFIWYTNSAYENGSQIIRLLNIFLAQLLAISSRLL
jgi:hypothetical protein